MLTTGGRDHSMLKEQWDISSSTNGDILKEFPTTNGKNNSFTTLESYIQEDQVTTGLELLIRDSFVNGKWSGTDITSSKENILEYYT